MTWKSYRNMAAVAEALVIIGLPFLKIRGESALRFDIPTLRLYLFGKVIWMQEFFVVLLALLTLMLLFIFTTNIMGRVWCGWLCPQTVLLDISLKSGTMRNRLGFLVPYLVLVPLSFLVSASLIWYFVSPYDFFRTISGRTESPLLLWFFLAISAVVYLDLAFLGRRFCKTVCPYAKLQSTLFDRNTLVVEFDPGRAKACMGCDKCVRACPVGIDIKHGLQMECIACAQCIDACRSMTEPRGVKSLINYTSGEGRIIRPKAVVLFALSLLLFLCLFYRISTLPPFAFDVLRSGELYHITEKGDVVNIYVLSIKNMRDREVTFRISVTRPDTMMVIGPAAVSVKAGEISHQNLILISRDPTAKGREVVFALKNPQGYELKRTGVFFSP